LIKSRLFEVSGVLMRLDHVAEQRIGNQIDAAFIFARTDFVKVGDIAPGQRLAAPSG
jgi:hypothetical protein